MEFDPLSWGLAAAFPGNPGWKIVDQHPVESYQQQMTRVRLEWLDSGLTEEVFVRVYRGYMSWWTLEAPDLPEREQAALRFAAGAGVPVPDLLCLVRTGDQAVAVLRRVPGVWLQPPISLEVATQLADLLVRLHHAPIRPRARLHLPDISLSALLPRLLRWAQEADTPALCRSVEQTADRLAQTEEQPAVLLHGDCHPGNLLSDGQHVTAIIDWEEAALGDPRLDVARLWGCLKDDAPEAADRFLHCYQQQAGYALGPLTIWQELMQLRDQIVSAWVKRHLAQSRPLPSANPEVWISE